MIEFSQNERKVAELMNETGKTRDELAIDFGWIAYDRIKNNASIDKIAVSNNAFPYNTGMNMSETFVNDDTIPVKGTVADRSVSPEYFDVFKIKFEEGQAFAWSDSERKIAIINGDERDYIGGHHVNDVDKIVYKNRAEEDVIYNVVGIVNKIKRDPFYPYENEVYTLFDRNMMKYLGLGSVNIFVRIKEGIDKDAFIETFSKDMSDQLSIGPLYLKKVTPFDIIKKKYMLWENYDNNFKSIGAISLFLLINIFLGIIGTFWFRTRERRNEIGLRMAIGASKRSMIGIFIGETLLLGTIASVFGFIISLNVGMADVLKDIGVPVPERLVQKDWLQYVINLCVTFFILVVVSSLAVWYPANQASETQPAIALRDE
ncbi:ABC transporter permease [Dysgonomonas sp. Marseille-P4361]|uniref:ABC transporter permease n=1 Tax=Dysgonomonas sp. Marseille-P4361 TaxID=2161820 RepID=UPI001358FA5E|nr:FtsX-like permease family protein [Dysgonomonas sp. Marseille-P4361]